MQHRQHNLILALLLIVVAPPASIAQWENAIWYFGGNAGLDFNVSPPRLLTDGRLNTYEGTAVISNPGTGALLFYTDGITVYNRRHQVMYNGTGLAGGPSSTQSATIVQIPASADRYLVFTAAEFEQDQYLDVGINYSVVDMSADSGFGAVVVKNVPLLRPATERLTAVPRCDGTGVWVITRELGSDAFRAWLVTSGGITDTVVSRAGPRESIYPGGFLQASPNGQRLAMTVFNIKPPSSLTLYDFDPGTGIVSNGMDLSTGDGEYGVCFSPSSMRLYVTGIHSQRLYQYDLTARSRDAILQTRVVVNASAPGGLPRAIQIAPDNRLYIARNEDRSLAVINTPDAPGSDCGYRSIGLDIFPRFGRIGLPGISIAMPVGRMLRDTAICSGESVQLGVGRQQSVTWSPADGLSCTNCASPTATPQRTTLYRVNYGSGRCRTIDSVLVTVGPLHVPLAPLTYIADSTQQVIMVPVTVAAPGPSEPFTHLIATIRVDSLTMRLVDTTASSVFNMVRGTLLDLWSVETVSRSNGSITLDLRGPQEAALAGEGIILRLRVALYLGRDDPSPLIVELTPVDARCPGAVSDTIMVVSALCGASQRQIEIQPRFALAAVTPNPAKAGAVIVLSSGALDHATVEVFDGRGARVALLWDATLSAGEHRFNWDPDIRSSGVYTVRATAGDMVRTQTVVMVK